MNPSTKSTRSADKAQARFQQGLELFEKGNLTLAKKRLDQTLKLQPQLFDALQLLGAIAHQNGELVKTKGFSKEPSAQVLTTFRPTIIWV